MPREIRPRSDVCVANVDEIDALGRHLATRFLYSKVCTVLRAEKTIRQLAIVRSIPASKYGNLVSFTPCVNAGPSSFWLVYR